MSTDLANLCICQTSSDWRTYAVGYGYYFRASDRVRIQRLRCKSCRRTFSRESNSLCYQQKKRQMNLKVFNLLCSSVSQRRTSKILGLNRKTVARKLDFMGKLAIKIIPRLNAQHKKARIMEFDDLETFEHTKLKPLSVTMAVESKTRRILGVRVSQMPARGAITKLSIKKYGKRKDLRQQARDSLFEEIKNYIEESAVIKSDQNPHYVKHIKTHFPNATHKTYKGRQARNYGHGELKKGGFDPLFTLNHSFAMLRDNIKRLARKTWCTTKIAEKLSSHIAIYVLYHNLELLKKSKTKSKFEFRQNIFEIDDLEYFLST